MLDREWRGLLHSLADRNDCAQLELSWAWEPTDNQRPLQDGEGKEAQNDFRNGNQIRKK